jgi:hypothetical protein
LQKDWLYQLTATKNQLMDRSLLKPLIAKLAELEKAEPITEELIFQYQGVIDRTSSQVTSASHGIIEEHKAKCAVFTSKLGGAGASKTHSSLRKAPAPPTGVATADTADKASSSEEEFPAKGKKPDAQLVTGLDEALRDDSKVEDAARERGVTRDESSAYMDMANEVRFCVFPFFVSSDFFFFLVG